jgi:hypothetical protein
MKIIKNNINFCFSIHINSFIIKISFIILLTNTLIFYSCKKEIDLSQAYIIAGDSSNIKNNNFYNYNKSISGGGGFLYANNYKDSSFFDIDNDGLNDLMFVFELSTNKWEYSSQCRVVCLSNNILIATIINYDTLYSISSINIYESDSLIRKVKNCDSVYRMNLTNNPTTSELNNVKSKEIQKNLYVQNVALNDTIDNGHYWISSTIQLFKSEFRSFSYMYSNNTYLIDSKNIKLGFWNNVDGYIGMQIKKGINIHYGWVRLKVDGIDNIYVISSNIAK